MKDNEVRERFDRLERMIAAATSELIGSKTTVEERLSRLQELAEAGRRFQPGPQEALDIRIAGAIGMSVGGVIFLAGMFVTWLLK